jgi:hypothetical protein
MSLRIAPEVVKPLPEDITDEKIWYFIDAQSAASGVILGYHFTFSNAVGEWL